MVKDLPAKQETWVRSLGGEDPLEKVIVKCSILSGTAFLPEKFHGQRSLSGYSPWGCKELDNNKHACALLLKTVKCHHSRDPW